MEEFLLLNTLLFIHSHSDQIKSIAPTLICFLNLRSIVDNKVVVLSVGDMR
jgi:hypothetical protein